MVYAFRVCGGSRAYPRNTGRKIGLHFRWDTNPSWHHGTHCTAPSFCPFLTTFIWNSTKYHCLPMNGFYKTYWVLKDSIRLICGAEVILSFIVVGATLWFYLHFTIRLTKPRLFFQIFWFYSCLTVKSCLIMFLSRLNPCIIHSIQIWNFAFFPVSILFLQNKQIFLI